MTSSRDELIRALDDSRREELDELNRLHEPMRRTSLLLGWLAGWLRAPARAQAEPLPEVEPGEVGLTFAGHASVLVRYAGQSIACDPMLGGRLGLVRRAVEPGLSPDELGDVRLILVSHAHRDHLHPPTLARLPRAATVIVPHGTGGRLAGLGFEKVIELRPGHSHRHGAIEVVATEVKHDPRGGRLALGYILRGPGPTVFFCGDSGYFDGFAELGRKHRLDVAILPIGGYVPAGFRERHMSPLDAIYAFEDLGARLLVPIHHSAFALSYETLAEPLAWLEELVAERGLAPWVMVLAAGASRTFK